MKPAGNIDGGDEGHDCLIVAGPVCQARLAEITVYVDINFHFPGISIPVHNTESKCRKKAQIRRDQGSVLPPVDLLFFELIQPLFSEAFLLNHQLLLLSGETCGWS